jgi:uncharacterized membrane protein YdfJ with MMPL/SSD domain
MVALLSLAVVDIPLVTSLGYTSALVVAVAVAAAVTLLPAILAIVGNRIDAWALPHRRTPKDDQRAHGWKRWAHFVGRRPLPCALVAVVVLVALALPTLDLYLGLISIGAAFGVVTAVFEKGWGVGIVGLDESVAIVSFVPLMMFAILLVPAVMTLLGESNWWFPRSLDRIVPNFSIEGDEWFRERDAAGAVPATPEPQRARALR